MRFNKKPRIYTSHYYIGAKEKEKAKENPESFYWNLRHALREVSLARIQETAHFPPYFSSQEKKCDLKECLEKCVQHMHSCPEHTFIYLLPENVSVRINPIIQSVEGEPKIELIKGKAETRVYRTFEDELFVEVLIRRTTKKEPKYVMNQLEKAGWMPYL